MRHYSTVELDRTLLMILVSVMIAAVARELSPFIGARVREVWMGNGTAGQSESAEPRAVFIQIGSPGNGATLLIDTHPQRARLHLVNHPPSGGTPTAFTDTLRRALRGARLANIEQPDFDRALHLQFESRDVIGNASRVTLVAELMGRRSNVILLDENMTIVDALKRLPPFLNRVRTVLPHRPYLPPPGDLRDPRSVVDWTTEIGEDWRKSLKSFNGISSLVLHAIEAEIGSGKNPDVAISQFFKANSTGSDAPMESWLCVAQPYPFRIDDSCSQRDESLSELLEQTAEASAAGDEVQSQRAALQAHLAKLEARVAAQRVDLQRARAHAADAELWQAQGILMLAHLREVGDAAARGQSTIQLSDGERSHTLEIEPKWAPADNATRLFNRARRARKLAEGAPAREVELDAEATRLQSWRQRLESAASDDCEVLNEIARDSGMSSAIKIPSRTRISSQAARPESKLRRADIQGWACFMGRSAEENQLLLSKVASSSDIWLHLRGRPSAHVIVKNQKGKEVPPAVLDEAARWLAITTLGQKTAGSGDRVEVIHTAVKWVRAIKGAPGKVTLQRAETRLVQL